MNKNFNSIISATNLEFESYLKKNWIEHELLEQYFSTIYKSGDKNLFLKRLDLVKKYQPHFPNKNNNPLWASVILSPHIEIDWLMSLGFKPNKESKIIEYIFFRKILYSKAWDTPENIILAVCDLLNKEFGKKIVLKQLET